MNGVLVANPVTIGWLRLAVGAVAIVAVYAPMFPLLVSDWASFPSLSHGFAVPLIAAWLVWARRDEIGRVAFAPSWSGLPLVAGGLARHINPVANAVRLDHHVIDTARDDLAAYRRDHLSPSGRVEARGAHVLAGPFACALVRSAHSADGNSRCAVDPHSPSPPARSLMSQLPQRRRSARVAHA